MSQGYNKAKGINLAKVTVKDLEQIVEKLRENIDTGSLDKQCKEL